MANNIEWTDETWNPVTGCTKVSTGCKHCYAERMWARLSAVNMPYHGRKFTDVKCHPSRLDMPLHWKKPRKIFVNSMSDLFHEDVPEQFIFDIFNIMIEAKQHTFQILTKRPERMLKVLQDAEPVRNVWLGVSIEDQETANERIPLLLKTPAAVRWISAEPLLESIDFNIDGLWFEDCSDCDSEAYTEDDTGAVILPCCNNTGKTDFVGIDWVVVGGESGPKARPMHPDWARIIRDQCVEAGVPFLFKQVGEWTHVPTAEDSRNLKSSRLKYFEHVDATFYREGKKKAGRLLDGRLWDEYPV